MCEGGGPMPSRKTRAAIRLISRSFSDPMLSLQFVARSFDLSPPHLCRELKASGLGFRERLHDARTKEAHRLLLESQLSIKQVAAAVGYRHSSHLSHHFRRKFGISPSDIRRFPTE